MTVVYYVDLIRNSPLPSYRIGKAVELPFAPFPGLEVFLVDKIEVVLPIDQVIWSDDCQEFWAYFRSDETDVPAYPGDPGCLLYFLEAGFHLTKADNAPAGIGRIRRSDSRLRFDFPVDDISPEELAAIAVAAKEE